MKKWMSALIAVILVLSMVTAFAAPVPSKTTSDLTKASAWGRTDGVTSVNGVDVTAKEPYVVVVPDTTMTLEEIDKLYDHVSTEGETPISYFDEETQNAILELLNKDNTEETKALVLDDLADWAINDFVTVDDNGYTEDCGDVWVQFDVATPYQIDENGEPQKMVALLGFYDGTRTEVAPNVYEFNVEWMPIEAEVVATSENGAVVQGTFTKDSMLKMGESVSTAMAFMSEPFKTEETK